MNNDQQSLLTEKLKLIYEFNDISPLFARVAASEIDYGNILDAIKILKKGIQLYPKYPSPYFILAYAHAYSGEKDFALSNVKIGCKLLGSNESYDYYKKRIEEILEERNSLTETKRPIFLNEETEQSDSEFYTNIEDKLDELAATLSKAKIIPKDAESEPQQIDQYSGKKIVSETLANIYFTQSKWDEALAAYKELIMIKPEHAAIYTKKIAEIKDKMKKK